MFKEEIQKDLLTAMKQKNKEKVLALRTLLTSIVNREKEKRYQISKAQPESGPEELDKEAQLSDEETAGIVFSEVKKRKEAIQEFKRGGREDLVMVESGQIEILKKYLPEQLSLEEIRDEVRAAIKRLGVQSSKEAGRVIGQLMNELKSRADGALVAEIVKELLQD